MEIVFKSVLFMLFLEKKIKQTNKKKVLWKKKEKENTKQKNSSLSKFVLILRDVDL